MDKLSSSPLFPSMTEFYNKIPQQVTQTPSELELPSKNAPLKTTSKKVDKLINPTKGQWSVEEDLALRTLTSANKKNDQINWEIVVPEFCKWSTENGLEGRIRKQCVEHYTNAIQEGLRKGPFDDEEKKLLMAKYPHFPNKWTLLREFFPDRTANDIKNCANSLFRKHELVRIETRTVSNTISKIQTDEIEPPILEDLPFEMFNIPSSTERLNVWVRNRVKNPDCIKMDTQDSSLNREPISTLDLEPSVDFEEQCEQKYIDTPTYDIPTPTYDDDQFPTHCIGGQKRKRFSEPLSPLSPLSIDTNLFSFIPNHVNTINLLDSVQTNKSLFDSLYDQEN